VALGSAHRFCVDASDYLRQVVSRIIDTEEEVKGACEMFNLDDGGGQGPLVRDVARRLGNIVICIYLYCQAVLLAELKSWRDCYHKIAPSNKKDEQNSLEKDLEKFWPEFWLRWRKLRMTAAYKVSEHNATMSCRINSTECVSGR